MTRQRNDKHGTEFGEWLRKQSQIDSSLGYVTTNIDYFWRNYNTGYWMLIEEKRHEKLPSLTQKVIFKILDHTCKNNENYHGFHLVQFENTSPDDGKIYLDGNEISKEELISFLQFKLESYYEF